MGFQEAIKTAYNKYADFNGTATKAEFWWYWLYILILVCVAAFIEEMIWPGMYVDAGPLTGIVLLAHVLPNWSTGARRLHDIGRSGWWQLLNFVPFIGLCILTYWWIQPSLKNTQFNNFSSNKEFEPSSLTPSDIKRDDINISNSDNNKQAQGKTKFR